MKGETQQFLELALRENAMLKNSLNVYAETATKALDKCEAAFQNTLIIRNEIQSLANALDAFVFRARRALQIPRKKFVSRRKKK